MTLGPHDFEVGEKVRFIRSYVDIIRRAHGHRAPPAWLDLIGTIARVEANGCRVAIILPGVEGAMTVIPTMLERAP
jgi:hypothetical protein